MAACALPRPLISTLILFGAVLASVGLLFPSAARAQAIGLEGLLNPEGSRLFPQTFVYPRHPGKPDPRWRTFNWKYTDLKTDAVKYRLYYYPEEEWTARFVIPQLNNQIHELTKRFKYTPTRQFSYLLFSTLREFREATIFNISEGVQGITSTTEATMAIPYWGETEAFRHVSTHEMVHQFQVQKANDFGGAEGTMALAGVPLWFIEGMAEYYSQPGIDKETRMYLRDVLLYPDKKRGHEMPKLFDEMPMTFITVYKVGQARIDFFETTFGEGTAQKLYEAALRQLGVRARVFAEVCQRELGKTPEELEKLWQEYLNKNYKAEADVLTQPLDQFEMIEAAGENLDLFDISTNGKMAAIREVDPLTGIASIVIIDLEETKERVTVATDGKPSLLSLYFFQLPNLALSDSLIAYVVSTTDGPELEWRTVEREKPGKIRLGAAQRIELHRFKLLQASSPTLSPDNSSVAFVGFDPSGKQNVYTMSLSAPSTHPRKLTNEYYSWKSLSWTSDGILGASDRTANRKYALYRIDPESGSQTQLTLPLGDQLAPEGSRERLYFQSWEGLTSQIHLLEGKTQLQLTDAKTALYSPKARQDSVYALGFRSGRYHLYRISPERQLRKPVANAKTWPAPSPWSAEFATLDPTNVYEYKPFVSSGTRIDNLVGFFSSGGVGGIGVQMSDLMRNYNISGEFAVLGDIKYTNSSVFLGSNKGRTSYVTGLYHTVQPRLDTLLNSDNVVRTYLHREFGGLGALQYPLGAFSYIDAELRLAGVTRMELNDPFRAAEWDAMNPGTEFLAAPTFRVGYDRILYEAFSGPLKGYGLLLESDTSVFPGRGNVSERLRLDVARYFHASARTVLAFQGMAGASFGGDYKNGFYVSSDDILRAYPFGDDRLFGTYMLAAKTELRFPIGSLFGFPPLRGLLAYDLGSIFNERAELASRAASSTTWGLALNIPPLSINFMFSYPIQVAPGPPLDAPVVHFTLRYLYL